MENNKNDILKVFEFNEATKNSISDVLFSRNNVKRISIDYDTRDVWTEQPKASGRITFTTNDVDGTKRFNGKDIFDVLEQMHNFLKTIN